MRSSGELPPPYTVVALARRAAHEDLKSFAWLAPEMVGSQASAVPAVGTRASDVYMLGGVFLEVITGCSQKPFEWLESNRLVDYRSARSTAKENTIEVGNVRI